MKTKKIKAYVLDDDGDLVMSVIEVPDVPEDRRPAFDPRTDSFPSKGMTRGNPEGGKSGSVVGL